MIDNENLDVRTITMGISLLDCIDEDIDKACTKVYDKICRSAKRITKRTSVWMSFLLFWVRRRDLLN